MGSDGCGNDVSWLKLCCCLVLWEKAQRKRGKIVGQLAVSSGVSLIGLKVFLGVPATTKQKGAHNSYLKPDPLPYFILLIQLCPSFSHHKNSNINPSGSPRKGGILWAIRGNLFLWHLLVPTVNDNWNVNWILNTGSEHLGYNAKLRLLSKSPSGYYYYS